MYPIFKSTFFKMGKTMIITKRLGLRLLFAAEIILFFLFYCFGKQGIQLVYRHKKENLQLAYQVKKLAREVKELATTVHAYQSNSFFQEKIARETLHMAHKDEQVYFR